MHLIIKHMANDEHSKYISWRDRKLSNDRANLLNKHSNDFSFIVSVPLMAKRKPRDRFRCHHCDLKFDTHLEAMIKHANDHNNGNYIKIGFRKLGTSAHKNTLVPEQHHFCVEKQMYLFANEVRIKQIFIPDDVRVVDLKHFCRKCNKFSIDRPEDLEKPGQMKIWSRAVNNMKKHEGT